MQHTNLSKFSAITIKFGRIQIAQASQFFCAGMATLICSFSTNGGQIFITPIGTTIANDNVSMSEAMRYALDCVANYNYND